MDGTRTLSGAIVAQLGEHVIKLGEGVVGDRIGAQADWLVKYAGAGIMPVSARIGPHAYVMPYCYSWPDGSDAREVWNATFELLAIYVWSHEPERPDEDVETLFFTKLCGALPALKSKHMVREVLTFACGIDWHNLPRCLTHGDPTFCNTMLTEDGDPLLCDPIPSGVLPDVRALDLGKLLQSCMGFETLVHGWRYKDEPPNPLWVRAQTANTNEWYASLAFAILHILRVYPYAPLEHHKEFTRVIDSLLGLTSLRVRS